MIFKCKMCGGDIEPIKDTNTGKCVYCKSVMTLPDLDNEKIINLYNRANALRMDNDFDKSREVYEKILELDNEQVEAHFGVLLCKYGVEYVDDPKTKKKIPTCHRTSDESIFVTSEYKTIKKQAYGDALALYEEEAKRIDEIQRSILSISSKEKPYDVFICYKETDKKGDRTNDSVIAQDIYDKLIESGLKVFFARITLEDKLGKEYEPYIYSALKTSKVMLVVGTKEENFNAVWVKNEWSRFLEMMKQDKGKVLIPVYSKIDAYKLPEEFSMFQAQSMDKVGALQDLTRGIKKVIDEYKTPELKDVDEETVAKVQKALEEAKSIGNGQYEVNVIKENLPVWYYVLCLASVVFYSFFRLATLSFSCVSVFLYNANKSVQNYDFTNPFIGLELIIILVLDIYFVLLFINRKTHKVAKKNYYIIMALLIFKILVYLHFAIVPSTLFRIAMLFGCDFIAVIVSHLVTPSWNLNTSSKQIMNLEEKNKQIQKNNEIRSHFSKFEKNKDNKLPRVAKIGLLLSVGVLVFADIIILSRYVFGTRNYEKNEAVDQIYILENEPLYMIYKVQNYYRYNTIMFLEKDGYYNLVSGELVTFGANKNYYLKVKTNNGLEGYVSFTGSHKVVCADEECEKRYKISNERDESVMQVRVISDRLNIRSSHTTYDNNIVGVAAKGDIFTVIEKYRSSEIWYKIKTSNGIEGWLCDGDYYARYLEVLDKK